MDAKIVIRFIGQLRSILLLISISLILPSFLFGERLDEVFYMLSLIYFLFLIGAVWQTIANGMSSQKRDDPEIAKEIGGGMYLFQTISIWLAHWISVYDYYSVKSLTLLLPDPLLYILGLAFMIISVFVIHSAVRELGEYFDRLVIKSNHQLITTGIYSVIRHPVYLSYFLLFCGMCIYLESLIGMFVFLVGFFVSFTRVMNVEENMLMKKFGAEYQKYVLHTKRLFPKIY